MSYAYMKALESAPENYDKGLKWLSWGKIDAIRFRITQLVDCRGKKVLEIGCGTGAQALQFIAAGAEYVGIDISKKMLSIALKRVLDKGFYPIFVEKGNEDRFCGDESPKIIFRNESVANLDQFDDNSFDVITATLLFSELQPIEINYILFQIRRILKPDGNFILADEISPRNLFNRLIHRSISFPLKILTYLLTQNSTHACKNLPFLIEHTGFTILETYRYQLGAFCIIHAKNCEVPIDWEKFYTENGFILPPKVGLLSKIWQLVLRLAPHKTAIGLIKVGNPNQKSPVFGTCNFKLTVHRLYNNLKKNRIDSWILVCPSKGINVWCAATGDIFNEESIITSIKVTGISNCIESKLIILPQLSAPGIDPVEVKRRTGWNCIWGPVSMYNIPKFLELQKLHQKKPSELKKIQFLLRDRLAMSGVIAFPMLILIFILNVILIFFNLSKWVIPNILTELIYYYWCFALWPLIPNKKGSVKMIFLTIVFILLVGIFGVIFVNFQMTSIFFPYPIFNPISWNFFYFWPLMLEILGLMVILIFDIDGMTPLRRSSYLRNAWNKGKMNIFERWGQFLTITPYGIIAVKISQCTGCGICNEVCPMSIFQLNEKSSKIEMKNIDDCINCRACINRCPSNALYFKPESEQAERYLKLYLNG